MSGRHCRRAVSRTTGPEHGDRPKPRNCSPRIAATGAFANDTRRRHRRHQYPAGIIRWNSRRPETAGDRSFSKSSIQRTAGNRSNIPGETQSNRSGGRVRIDGRVQTTNLPWVVDSRHLAQELKLDRVDLINDLFANAHGIALLQESDFVVLNAGTPSPTGNRALISAGTGLGEAGLLAEAGGGFRPFPSEGGHADFAPTSELQIELLRYLFGR